MTGPPLLSLISAPQARCVEDSTVFSINWKEIMTLIEKYHRMGFLIMRRIENSRKKHKRFGFKITSTF